MAVTRPACASTCRRSPLRLVAHSGSLGRRTARKYPPIWAALPGSWEAAHAITERRQPVNCRRACNRRYVRFLTAGSLRLWPRIIRGSVRPLRAVGSVFGWRNRRDGRGDPRPFRPALGPRARCQRPPRFVCEVGKLVFGSAAASGSLAFGEPPCGEGDDGVGRPRSASRSGWDRPGPAAAAGRTLVVVSGLTALPLYLAMN